MNNIELIIFDLGNILVELGESPFPLEWNMNGTKNTKEWLYDEFALKFEKGEIGETELANQLIKAHKLNQTPETVLSHFTNWIKGLYPEVLETIEKLKSDYSLAILSNTNETHWPVLMKDFGLEGNFDYYFASYQMNLAKPDLKIYEQVIKETGYKAENILFFDDNFDNIESAKKLGINAVHLVGFETVKEYLTDNKYI